MSSIMGVIIIASTNIMSIAANLSGILTRNYYHDDDDDDHDHDHGGDGGDDGDIVYDYILRRLGGY